MFLWDELGDKMDDDTIQWLVIIAAVTAGLAQAYRVIAGDGGSLAALAVVGWGVVILISGWQLHGNPS
jgi:hypothetical protein